MMRDQPGIYQIRCIPTGKLYVGSAKDMLARQWVHLCQLRSGKHCNRHLLRAFRKYGEAQFEWAVLEVVEGGEKALIIAEQKWISANRSSDRKYGYNIIDTARRVFSMTGRRHTSEARAKITAAQIGVTRALGVDTGRAKLDNRKVRDIRGLLAAGYSYKQVADAIGVTKPTIQAIAIGKTWGHVVGCSGDVSHIPVPTRRVLRGSAVGTAKLSEDQVASIRHRLANGERGRKLANEYGLSESHVSAIKLGKTRTGQV